MPKGIKRESGLAGEIADLDRMLLSAVRKNLSVAQKMVREPVAEELKVGLEGFLSRHPLNAKKAKAQTKPERRTLSERDRLFERLAHQLRALNDINLRNIMELAKSMARVERINLQEGAVNGSDRLGKRVGKRKGRAQGEPEQGISAAGDVPAAS